jgi:UDP:flavonoid glycosyltransferase YjiC (YdhE family)
MRVLVTTWAWPSHCFPLVPVAWALAAAGHDVRVAVQPGGAGLLRRTGLVGCEVGREVDFPGLFRRMAAGLAADGRREALAARAEVTASTLDGLVALAGHWRPDLVLFSPAAQAGPLLAALLGVPAVRHLLGPDFGYHAGGSGASAREPLSGVLDRYGLGEVDLLGTLTLDPCPAALRVPADYRRQAVRYVPFNGNVLEPDWVREPAPRPRICVTWGGTVPRLGEAAVGVPQVVDAVRGIAAEVVVGDVTGDVVPGGAGVRVADSPPLQLVLPGCDLLVSQGGAGTVLTALHAGIPHLVVPQIADQGFNAELLTRSGAGRCLVPESCHPDALREVAGELLAHESYRSAAARHGAEMAAQPSPAEVVGVLEELTGSGSR